MLTAFLLLHGGLARCQEAQTANWAGAIPHGSAGSTPRSQARQIKRVAEHVTAREVGKTSGSAGEEEALLLAQPDVATAQNVVLHAKNQGSRLLLSKSTSQSCCQHSTALRKAKHGVDGP